MDLSGRSPDPRRVLPLLRTELGVGCVPLLAAGPALHLAGEIPLPTADISGFLPACQARCVHRAWD